MHDDRTKKDIQDLMDLRGLTVSEAESVLSRQRDVDQVRQEAEQILGQKLPSIVSSEFIEKFCALAPQIGVCALKSRFDKGSTLEDWRFLVDFNCLVEQRYANGWFTVEVIPYGADLNPPSVVRVEGSPAQVLVDFVERCGPKLQPFCDRGELENIPDELFLDCLSVIVSGLESYSCRVQGRDSASVAGMLPRRLEDVVDDMAGVPPFVPSDAHLHDIRLALDMKPYDITRQIAFDELKQLVDDKAFDMLVVLTDQLLRSLGEARYIEPTTSPLSLYQQLCAESVQHEERSKQCVAVSYLQHIRQSEFSGVAVEGEELLAAAFRRVQFHVWNAKKNLSADGWPGMRESLLERIAFFTYVQDALNRHRGFLVGYFEN